MNEFSKEVIEIDGVEYTLFLNRTGMIAIEKYIAKEQKQLEELQNLADGVNNGETLEINDDVDPLAGLEDISDVEGIKTTIYKKMFWIMLSTTHKLSYSVACELYDKAVETYGKQVDLLLDQIVQDTNINRIEKEENKNVKNLKALRPTN